MSQIIFVPPLAWDGAKPGRCFSNVQEMIRRRGGAAVFGWSLSHCGPMQADRGTPSPLFRCWVNHVVWRDTKDNLWEVSPNVGTNLPSVLAFSGTGFIHDPLATFVVQSDNEWHGRPARYEPIEPAGEEIADCFNRVLGAADNESREHSLSKAITALQQAGYSPRELRLESDGVQLVKIVCLVD
jgi:hypothetical protein